jgi:hypothetical protein
MNNMEVWNKLEKTDPKHTKDFKRAGGFSGTAIKPMYAIQKMTEVFGACGEGWGYTKPEYQTVDGSDGQKLVYCTVGLWHGSGKPVNNDYSDLVWGVGGDFIVVKQSAGLRSDDEAFKKSFTDALMNAMKHLGMSADVHMGQFDGSKYNNNPVKSKLMEPERKAFIIKTINEAKDLDTATKLQKEAKEECVKLNDTVSYEEISKAGKIKRDSFKPTETINA